MRAQRENNLTTQAPVPIYMQADFVWAIRFCAIPTGQKPPCALN